MNATKLLRLKEQLDEVIVHAKDKELLYHDRIHSVHSKYRKSAKNLAHYLGLRAYSMSEVQRKLGLLGLSRLARAEAHVLYSLRRSSFFVQAFAGLQSDFKKGEINIKAARKSLKENTANLLGSLKSDRRVRIMVTMPSEGAYDSSLAQMMIEAGMDCARINCAHDSSTEWLKMIHHTRNASKMLGKEVKIAMDLGGPKIRTGPIAPGPRVIKVRPQRDDRGKVIRPACIRFRPIRVRQNDIPVDRDWIASLQLDMIIRLTDTRGRKCKLKVVRTGQGFAEALFPKSIYFETGMTLEANGNTTKVGDLPEKERFILLEEGDQLLVTKQIPNGMPSKIEEHGDFSLQAKISCACAELFQDVEVGEEIYFDDGKITGEIIRKDKDQVMVRILRARPGGAKLKSDKGINLPATNLKIKGLTLKDRADLKFVAKHADIVNCSFINSAEEVREVHELLMELGVENTLGVVLKIETQKAFNHLPEILLESMKLPLVGVMIARGDLAVEAGWERIGWVQKEILALCSAAHIPVIWATQVLENLAKKGRPSRSEITDAVQSMKAECVMLNKGPYIVRAIELLDKILTQHEQHQLKGDTMLPALSKL
ncbi:MAG: hypothetical protein KI790_03695 [Cyclobacteriaceae bacterium]|nr:hypothetical protein [Cyclobacteriaceae bacterium HetDA_MAG_MS6]